MPLYFSPEFIGDLQQHGDANFAKRVLQKVVDGTELRPDGKDHRYHGIQNAWIRYVSRGNSAYRVIYVRRGADVFLYRAGEHAIEDNLTSPGELSGIPIEAISAPSPAKSYDVGSQHSQISLSPAAPLRSPLLKNFAMRYLKTALLSRRLVPHKRVTLISPFLSIELFEMSNIFGKMLFDLIGEGTEVHLITRPPSPKELGAFERLEERDLVLHFHETLHAKLFIFEIDEGRGRSHDETIAILGSANLTQSGLAFCPRANEELCYELRGTEIEGAVEFAAYLKLSAVDLQHIRLSNARRRII
jgi:hypothetical protein